MAQRRRTDAGAYRRAPVGLSEGGMVTAAASSPANAVFLRGCAAAGPADWQGLEKALRGLDHAGWKSVAVLAVEQGFAGLLARSLAWAQDGTGLRVPILEELSDLRRGQLVQHLARRAAARRAAQALQLGGIPFVIFKGVVLGEEIYGDLSLRGFHDCDIMVPRERVDEAFGLARELGYALVQFDHVRDYVRLGAHAAGMVHPDGTSLDLHWSIAPDMLEPERIATIWEHCRPSGGDSYLPGLRLSPEMTLIHLAKHFHSHQYTSIKPLVDFYVAARSLRESLDVDEIRNTARALDLLPFVDIAVALCERCFIPGSLPPALAAGKPRLHARLARLLVADDLMLRAHKRSRLGNWVRYLLAAGTFASAARSILAALIPGKLVLVQFFNRPFRPGMYPQYYWRQLLKVLTLSTR
jgi:hypothetical protein